MSEMRRFWMPFTDNRAFEHSPRLLVSAEGIYYTDIHGRRILDGASGLWCVNAGHRRSEIADAMIEQIGKLDYAPCFNFGHPIAFEFAERLASHMPHGLGHILFANSGSEAVDTALKVALAYQEATGERRRYRLVGRERGYHGVGFGGMSVGGLARNRAAFGPMLTGVDHLRHTFDPRAVFTRGQAEVGVEVADDLERIVELHGADTIAAVVVEPVAGSTGVLVPPRGYLQRLREITSRHGILLIFDEVITAFGRLGAMTGSEYFGVTPDIIVLAKGLTNGAAPMGAVAVSEDIYGSILEGSPPGIDLHHGYTCSGHPLAAAAGLATLRVFETDQLCARARQLSPLWEEEVHRLAGLPMIVDVRNLGLAAAVELEQRPGHPGSRGVQMRELCFQRGLMVRVTGDTVALAPPLIIEPCQIHELVEIVRDALGSVH